MLLSRVLFCSNGSQRQTIPGFQILQTFCRVCYAVARISCLLAQVRIFFTSSSKTTFMLSSVMTSACVSHICIVDLEIQVDSFDIVQISSICRSNFRQQFLIVGFEQSMGLEVSSFLGTVKLLLSPSKAGGLPKGNHSERRWSLRG
jgi:hypothetical protein